MHRFVYVFNQHFLFVSLDDVDRSRSVSNGFDDELLITVWTSELPGAENVSHEFSEWIDGMPKEVFRWGEPYHACRLFFIWPIHAGGH